MAAIPIFSPSVVGTPPTMNAAAAGDTCEAGDKGRPNILIVNNTAGSSMTVTVAVPGNQESGVATSDPQYTVPATTGVQWIPILDSYRDPTTGTVALTYSTTTSVTRALVRF